MSSRIAKDNKNDTAIKKNEQNAGDSKPEDASASGSNATPAGGTEGAESEARIVATTVKSVGETASASGNATKPSATSAITYATEGSGDIQSIPLITDVRQMTYNQQFDTGRTQLIFREIPRTLDVNAIKKVNYAPFVYTNSPKGYLKYHVTSSQYTDNTQIITDPITREVVLQTLETFRYGTSFANIEYNDDLFTEFGLSFKHKVPVAEGMLTPVSTTSINDHVVEIIMGKVMLLFHVMEDTRIVMAQEKIEISGALPPNLSRMVQHKFVKPPGVNPALMVASTNLQWLVREITEAAELNQYKYLLGVTHEETNQTLLVRHTVTSNQNIDHFAANVLNGNLLELERNSITVQERKNEMMAHCCLGSSIVSPHIPQIRPELRPDPKHDLRVIMLAAIKYKGVEKLLLDLGTRYVEKSNVIRLTTDRQYYPTAMPATSETQLLMKAIMARVAEADETQIWQYMAREITPNISLKIMESIDDDFGTLTSIIIVYELILFCWLFPNTFESIKGSVQNVMLRFFSRWYPIEYQNFMATYGVTYIVDDAGVERYTQKDELWEQAQYVTNEYPALFGNQTFALCPNINLVMGLFKPQGFLRVDTEAIRAKMPRLSRNPSHYIPHVQSAHSVTNKLEEAHRNMTRILINCTQAYITRDNRQKATRDRLLNWFEHMDSRMTKLAPSMTNHWSVMYASMSNHMLNFTQNFNGDYSRYKPLNYAVVGVGGLPVPLREGVLEYNDSINYVNTRIVWPILCQSTTPFMRQQGDGQDKVPIHEDIVFPDGPETYENNLAVMQMIRKMVIPDAFISYILSSAYTMEVRDYDLNNDDVVSIITLREYQERMRERLVVHDLPAPLELTMNTTAQQVANYLAGPLKVIRVPTGRILGTAMVQSIVEQSALVILDNFNNVRQSFVNLPPYDIDNDEYATRYESLNKYVTLRLRAIDPALRRLNSYIPPVSQAQVRLMMEYVSRRVGQSMGDFNKLLLKHLGEMKRDSKFIDMQLRRLNFNKAVQRFDRAVDPDAFEDSEFFLTPGQYRRLQIALRMCFNDRLDNLRTGVRIVEKEMIAFEPDETPEVPDDYVVREYVNDDSLFAMESVNYDTRYVYVTENGERIVQFNERPKVHLIITDRRIVLPEHYDSIIGGIKMAKWIVDVEDVRFISQIVALNEPVVGPSYEELLSISSHVETVHFIQFQDGLMKPSGDQYALPMMGRKVKTIFPLNAISNARSMRALIRNRDGTSIPGSSSPHPCEMDTGYMEGGMIFYTNGDQKIEQPNVSMTNPIIEYSTSVKPDEDLNLKITPPDDIIGVRL